MVTFAKIPISGNTIIPGAISLINSGKDIVWLATSSENLGGVIDGIPAGMSPECK